MTTSPTARQQLLKPDALETLVSAGAPWVMATAGACGCLIQKTQHDKITNMNRNLSLFTRDPTMGRRLNHWILGRWRHPFDVSEDASDAGPHFLV